MYLSSPCPHLILSSLGSMNVCLPSPPNCVPKIEKRAVFCDIGIVCPWQKAHNLGAKFPANNLTSAIVPSMTIISLYLVFVNSKTQFAQVIQILCRNPGMRFLQQTTDDVYFFLRLKICRASAGFAILRPHSREILTIRSTNWALLSASTPLA